MSQAPHVAVTELATQLQDDRFKSNMKDANNLVDKVEEIKNGASNIPEKPFEQMKNVVCSWRDSIEYALNESMATGDMAMCSWWFNPKVELKLKDLFEEFKGAEDAFAAIKQEAFQELIGKMVRAMNTITPAVKELYGLPDKLQIIADQATSSKSRPVADTSSMKECLKTDAEMNTSLQDLKHCQTRLPQLVRSALFNYNKLSEFFSAAEDRIRDAFIVPAPLCCMSGYVMDQPHVAVSELMEHTEKGQNSLGDLKQFTDVLDGLQQALIGLDLSKIGDAVQQFSLMAKPRLEQLDKLVDESKERPSNAKREIDNDGVGGGSCFRTPCFRGS